jgi:hypothetical protein
VLRGCVLRLTYVIDHWMHALSSACIADGALVSEDFGGQYDVTRLNSRARIRWMN